MAALRRVSPKARPSTSGSAVERLLFERPWLYRTKRFLIERVLWGWLLTGLLRREPRPMPGSLPGLAGLRVLLAGCGPGDATTGPALDGAAAVTAFDRSPHFSAACARNRPEWTVCCADLLAVPLPDDAVDVAVLYSTLHHLPFEARRALAELTRVASAGVFVVEGVVPERGLLRRLLLLWYRLVDGGHHYYTRAELHAAVGSLGWRVASESLHGPIGHMWLARLEPAAKASAA